MTSTATRRHAQPVPQDADDPYGIGYRPGPLGRLGLWVTHHRKATALVWLFLVIGLGAFAPKVEANLSGAGWQADGSESVAVRELATESFGGNASSAIQVVIHSTDGPVTQGTGADVIDEVTAILTDEPRIAEVIAPPARRHPEPGRLDRRHLGRGRRGPQRDGPRRRRPQGRSRGTVR